ncbi:MAG: S-adenosylmethionine decarboxylase [Candidatus Cloacimonetes bacterium]|nr:S-adenosylmethionine decarboxylase [Candidatus Cloacimonadota bacterium]
MEHIMLDAYKCSDSKLNDMRALYNTISKITDYLSLKTIMPPIIIPYFYGKEQSDDGISAFVLLKGGHFTIHTFPERECYFVDLLYSSFFDSDKFVLVLKKELPYGTEKIYNINRNVNINEQKAKTIIDENKDFGPHYLIKNLETISLDFSRIYAILDKLPPKLSMTPIMRPMVITDNVKKPIFISGMTMIAESHIALHYNIEEKTCFADIFSCQFINCSDFKLYIENELGVACENELITRGSKHAHLLPTRDDIVERFSNWRNNI